MDDINAAVKNKEYILIVDTNVADRFSLCMLFQRFGYTIFTTGTAEESIEFMNIAPPVALVVESSLAAAFLSWTKKNPAFSNIPLILVLAPKATLEDHRIRETEFAAYLRKPINVEALYRVIQSVIEKGSRLNIRIPTQLTATLEDERSGREGYITALSEDGAFVWSLEPRPESTRVPISFEINGRIILLEAIVLYRTTVDEGTYREPGMGMKFDRISPVDRERIKTYILDQVKEEVSLRGDHSC